MAEVEVPIPGTDSVKWTEIAVPSVSCSSTASIVSPSVQDCGSCSIVGQPPHYVVWRIHRNKPRNLELLEFAADEEFPGIGLRISFPEPLFPGAVICESKGNFSHSHPYFLYALTVSGVAYLLKLRNMKYYASCAMFPPEDIVNCSVRSFIDNALITSVAASLDCFVVGRNDGLVLVFQLGLLDPSSPGFVHEIRDDVSHGRLWGFMSRSKTVGPVQDISLLKINGLNCLIVLHLDGTLRAWDLSNRTRLLCHTISVTNPHGACFVKFWMGKDGGNASELPLAVLCRNDAGSGIETLYHLKFHFTLGQSSFSIGPKMLQFHLENGRCIDVKVTFQKLWILKDNGLVVYNLPQDNNPLEIMNYKLHEIYVADQLFQHSERSLDDLLVAIHSAVSSERVPPFLSSIFIRRLLHSGVYQQAVMRSTLMHYTKDFVDVEFQALDFEGLKKEICSLVEREDIRGRTGLLMANWKNFCQCYFKYWCENNLPCGLAVDSSANIVLMRRGSLSSFRALEYVEQLIDGINVEPIDAMPFISSLSDDDAERKILMEVLICVEKMSSHFGKAASTIFYESVVSMPADLSKDVFSCLTDTMENLCFSSARLPEMGHDLSHEKEISNRKKMRKFSIEFFLSLSSMHKKASSWSVVLSSIERHLQYLVPLKITQKVVGKINYSVNSSILAESISQISKVMFETSVNVFLFASYLSKIGRQIQMTDDDISRVQMELCPMIQETIFDWLVIYFLSSTPSESMSVGDFNSQLSSLQIDNIPVRQSWRERLGKCDFKLVDILLLTNDISTHRHSLSSNHFLNGEVIVTLVHDFASWYVWGNVDETSFMKRSIDIALVLFRHNQFNNVENLLKILETNYQRDRAYGRFQDTGGDWFSLQHLLGCCHLAQARHEIRRVLKDKKMNEAIRCFFRASSGHSAAEVMKSMSHDAGLPTFDFDDHASAGVWKLQYYQWAMQLFEQYEFSEGASRFALAALEEVDESYVLINSTQNGQCDSIATMKGRLWANVFKFMLDLNHLEDAYCALLANPDEESKFICLRRFINVLVERGAMKVLCDGMVPLIGLADKIEQELTWKAERSNVLATPSAYKFLYAFEMRRHNWKNAARYMFQYASRLSPEAYSKDASLRSSILQEKLNAISAAINALHLVHPHNAWIDVPPDKSSLLRDCYPNKKLKGPIEEALGLDGPTRDSQCYVAVDDLENEYVLTSAEYLLSLANVEWTAEGRRNPSDLVDMLAEANLYDTALNVVMKLWSGSSLMKELERFFAAMSLQYCSGKAASSSSRILTGDVVAYGCKWNADWDTLELYLRKYRDFHPGLPAVVAEVLLRSDPRMELPLWLVHMFTESRTTKWGMTGQESNAASLFALYVNYGRYAEATNLLLAYIDSYASAKPSDLYKRKKPFASWFPYTTIERLWCQLDELMKSGHVAEHSDKLRRLIHAALLKHLTLLKVDGEDAVASASL